MAIQDPFYIIYQREVFHSFVLWNVTNLSCEVMFWHCPTSNIFKEEAICAYSSSIRNAAAVSADTGLGRMYMGCIKTGEEMIR